MRPLPAAGHADGSITISPVQAIGERNVGSPTVNQTFTATDQVFNFYSNSELEIEKWSKTTGNCGNDTGNDVDVLSPGDSFCYRVKVTSPGTTILTDVSLYDPLPTGLSYTQGSGSVTCDIAANENVRDEFSSGSYGSDDGSQAWPASWIETDALGNGATGGHAWVTNDALQFRSVSSTSIVGNVQDPFTTNDTYNGGSASGIASWNGAWMEENDVGGSPDYSDGFIRLSNSNNRLEFRAYDGTGTETGMAIGRTMAVTGLGPSNPATITIDATVTEGMQSSEQLRVEYAADGGPYTEIGTLTGNGWIGSSPFPFTITGFTGTSINLRFRALTNFSQSNGSFALIDDIDIDVSTASSTSSASGTAIQRTADLTDAASAELTFTTAAANLEAGDTLVVEASNSPTGTFTALATYTAGTPDVAQPYDLMAYASSQTTIRFRVAGGYSEANETFSFDDVDISYYLLASSTFDSNDPPNFLASATGCAIAPGESLTLSFDVAVEDPLATGIEEITNTAAATSAEIPVPEEASVTDPVLNPSSGTATIGDLVWYDDGDGIKEVGEAGIPNVEVTLKDEFGTPLQVTTTNNQGRYLFTGVPYGYGFYVEVTGGLPSGYAQVPATGSNDKTDPFDLYEPNTALGNNRDEFGSTDYDNSDGSVDWSGNSWSETDSGGTNEGADGFVQMTGDALTMGRDNGAGNPFTIQRTLSVPTGANSATLTFDYASTGGWETSGGAADLVALEISMDGGTNYTVLQSWNSDSSGSSSFDISDYLTASDTIIRFRGHTTAGSEILSIDDLNVAYTQAGDPIQEYLDADLGYEPAGGTAIIGDRVWSDADSDGVQDAGEPGLNGVTVRLYPDTDGDSNPDDTSVGLVSGGLDLDGDEAITSADDGVVVDNGGTPRVVINGRVDWDGDGIIESNGDDDCTGCLNLGGEVYSLDAGALSYVSGGSDDGVTPDITNYRMAVTSGNGNYSFSVAASGSEDYVIEVDSSQAALSAYDLTTQATFSYIDVENGIFYLSADVGVEQNTPETTYSIQDRIWLDSNSDGDQDTGESGIAGVTVDLLDASGNVVATTTTDANGDFTFTGVPAGVRYRWRVTDQNGVLSDYYPTTSAATASLFQMPNTLDEADDEADGNDDDNVNYSSPSGPSGYQPHFGYNVTRSIGDTVFNDLDGDGTQDAGEPGLSGVVVKLYNDVDGDGVIDSGDTLQATLVTDANGNYLFSGLTNSGNYIVSIESPPSGYTYTGSGDCATGMADCDGSTPGQQNAASVGAGGESDLSNDFPYQAQNAVTLSGTVWEDDGAGGGTAKDGVQDSGEGGFAGVTIELYEDSNGNGVIDAGEPRIRTTQTDSNGDYSFTGIPGSGTQDYIVRLTDENGVLSGSETTYEKTSPFNGLESVKDLNADVTDLDFGYYQEPVATPITLASIDSWQSTRGLAVVWTTATETRNVGFHLYGRMLGEETWQRLTERLVPSKVIDSLVPQGYEALFPDVQVDELMIEDWDTSGQTCEHGPFAVGRMHGFDAVANAQPIDWAAIRTENAHSMAQRQQSRRLSALTSTQPDALLWVTEPGVQRVSFDDLQAAGADFSDLDFGHIALTDRGKARPRHFIDANANGLFDSGDAIEFAGALTPTLYSARNAYRLLVDTTGNLVRVANSKTLSANKAISGVFPAIVRVENQRDYSYTSPIDDPWYDQWLFAYGGAASLERSFDLPGYAGGETTLHLRHWGVTDWPGVDDDHHLIVSINGTQVADIWFDGSADASQAFVLPDGLVTETGNTLTLEAPGDTGFDYDIQAFDSLSLHYARRSEASEGAWQGRIDEFKKKYAISGCQGEAVAWKGRQRRVADTGLTGGTLYIRGRGDWIAADERAFRTPDIQTNIPQAASAPVVGTYDYLIISHPQFIDAPAMADLVDLQEGRGYRVEVVDVESLYALYSDHEVDPMAISKYVKGVKPLHTLLVGADSFDYHDYLSLGSQSFIPTHYVDTKNLITFSPADGRYVDFNGDLMPQKSIGRLPVHTEAEFTQLVAKLINHNAPTIALLTSGPSDAGRLFAAASEGYGTQLPSGLPYQEIYVDDIGLEPAKELLQEELEIGGALVSYVGHSSYSIWGLNPSHGILYWSDDARALTNSQPHILTQWGCWNTYFVDPRVDTMANGFLLQDAGASAVLGAASLTDIDTLLGLGNTLFEQVGRQNTIGEALYKAYRKYAEDNPGSAERMQGFVLLGDPAAEVR